MKNKVYFSIDKDKERPYFNKEGITLNYVACLYLLEALREYEATGTTEDWERSAK